MEWYNYKRLYSKEQNYIPASMLEGSLVTRLLSMLSLSMSPECLATVTVTSTPFFRRILVQREEEEEEKKRPDFKGMGKKRGSVVLTKQCLRAFHFTQTGGCWDNSSYNTQQKLSHTVFFPIESHICSQHK